MRRLQKEIIPMTCIYFTDGICKSFPFSVNMFFFFFFIICLDFKASIFLLPSFLLLLTPFYFTKTKAESKNRFFWAHTVSVIFITVYSWQQPSTFLSKNRIVPCICSLETSIQISCQLTIEMWVLNLVQKHSVHVFKKAERFGRGKGDLRSRKEVDPSMISQGTINICHHCSWQLLDGFLFLNWRDLDFAGILTKIQMTD